MPEYPKWLQIEPLGDAWPGERTKQKVGDQFQSTVAQTGRKLSRELERIGATNPRLRIAVERFQITIDGSRLKSGQQPWHSGVVLVFDTKQGEQVYPSDGYLRWQANLHAIALTLEALRALDRWMVTHGQQYRGFLALEPARAMPSAPFGSDPADVRRWLAATINTYGDFVSDSADNPRQLVTRARASTHPDRGRDTRAEYEHVATAEGYLREAGQL